MTPFKTMAINVDGTLKPGVSSKDIILAVIAKIGTGGGQGYVLEYRGEAIEALSMEARMTICNMSIEAGARAGMIAPDEITFEYLKGRPHAPEGQDWDDAVEYWRSLRTDDGATFDAEITIDANTLEPFVTWGTNPGQGVFLSDSIPMPESFDDPADKDAAERALEYMALEGGTPMKEIPVDTVFLGSCTKARIEDLRMAAAVDRRRMSGQDVQVLWRRFALCRLFDVSGHEPGPVGPGGARSVYLKPKLRRSPGQGRSYPPGVTGCSRSYRRSWHAVLAVRPGHDRLHRRPELTRTHDTKEANSCH